MTKNSFDAIIIGAGIIGLSIARAFKISEPNSRILILEKEDTIGKHASGRNSGVLHSGIYYKENSLKAKICADGARLMREYCEQYALPLKKIGKVILPVKKDDNSQLKLLYQRAQNNGVVVSLIDNQQLQEIEPNAHSLTGMALYSPNTAVVDSKAILQHMLENLKQQNVSIRFNTQLETVDEQNSTIYAEGEYFNYGVLYNAAGLYADKVAHLFGIAKEYTLLPFKGIYYQLSDNSNIKCNGLIYPVPDLNVPFLGVHFTKTINDEIFLGPTALPAFGRENYHGFQGFDAVDTVKISYYLLQQYLLNKQGFRRFLHNESLHFIKPYFAKSAQSLVPSLKTEQLIPSNKVGIRAQLFDSKNKELVMDFLVKRHNNTIHVLNAVSPAFTSALSFSKYIVEGRTPNDCHG
jgi:L-2-hydroxyglutarate oxidase